MTPTPRVTGAVIARDEETTIAGCLRSLAWTDELLVIDSGSRDRTVEIARRSGARVEHRPFTNFAEQRNAALDWAETEWVFFLDADERISRQLAAEARAALERPEAGFWIPRRNIILGHRMRGGGWWPDKQLRLLRRERARYDPAQGVHEVARLDGPAGELTSPIIHYNYRHLRQLFVKQWRYAQQDALDRVRRGERVRPHHLLAQPARAFHRRFIQWHGYRDGLLGLFLAGLLAWYELVTLLLVRRLEQNA
ncbi:MAG: glycosyltransferase family 2 protein [Chloroflexota bacterium]|nr:glycosyltransferase family 2 protein [Dehalococcoidia bacterium]MDW8253962.1 glycosyltransferase family 2 protein [Chloroflexota bacterium]